MELLTSQKENTDIGGQLSDSTTGGVIKEFRISLLEQNRLLIPRNSIVPYGFRTAADRDCQLQEASLGWSQGLWCAFWF